MTSLSDTAPSLHGLVLAGGSSSRMGFDKTAIAHRGLPHRQFLCDALKKFCSQVYLSCRRGQRPQMAYPRVLQDLHAGIGPISALATAFAHDRQSAWFIIAADLALFDEEAMSFLVTHRDQIADVTAFRDPQRDHPEPFAAIWEPSSSDKIREAIKRKSYSPVDLLKNCNVYELSPEKPHWLLNVNTPDDLKRVKKILS